MKIGFIGAGKVGTSLGKYFVDGNLPVIGYYSRHRETAIEAAKFTGTQAYEDLSQFVYDSDVIFLTVSDGAIQSVYHQIQDMGIHQKIICHCSGAMTANEAFAGREQSGAFGYSIHPLFPISSRFDTYQELSDAFFCLEGDEVHMQMWKDIFHQLGNPVKIISADCKVKYHAACAIASNLVCALMDTSFELLQDCGFDESEAGQAVRPLVMHNIDRIFKVGAVDALTGAVERGDTETVRKHLRCLDSYTQKDMYRAVSNHLIDMAMAKHPDTDYDDMRMLLKRAQDSGNQEEL